MKDPKEIWNEMTYEQRLAATMVIFGKVCEHAREGGTYRYLIYNRLGFNQDAYIHLYPEGMIISNEFVLDELWPQK